MRAAPSLAGVEVIGPSLHDVASRSSYQGGEPSGGAAHFEQLAATGIAQWQDRLGLHSYPNAGPPLEGLDERLALVRDAFGADVLVHVTETGYHNALEQSTNTEGTYRPEEESLGPRPTSEEAAAVYLRRAALQYAALGLPWVLYELLDDPDPAPKDQAEANFGLWRATSAVPSTWSRKPAAVGLATLLDSLGAADPATISDRAQVPEMPPVRLEVSSPSGSSVQCVLTSADDGRLTAHLFRDVPMMDPATRAALEVESVPVTVETAAGRWSADVGADVTSIAVTR